MLEKKRNWHNNTGTYATATARCLTQVAVDSGLVGRAPVVDASAGRAAGQAVGGHDRARGRGTATHGAGSAAAGGGGRARGGDGDCGGRCGATSAATTAAHGGVAAGRAVVVL